MKEKFSSKSYRPSLGTCLLIFAFLVVIMGISQMWLDFPVHMAIVFAMGFAILILLLQGVSWDSVMDSIVRGGAMGISTVLILYVIGMVIGSWLASGTVPYLIYYGLKLISPNIFLLASLIASGIVALSTGSSWSTAGTIGVALMAIGSGLGVNPAMTAGAVVSGAFVGDKISPLSDTTNLAPAVAEGDLFDHIKAMFYTTVPGFLIAAIAYFVIGMRYASGNVDMGLVTGITDTLASTFNFNVLLLIPPILVIGLAVKKVPALISLFISAVVAALIAIFVQGESVPSIMTIMDTGFVSETGLSEIDILLSRGGLASMNWTASLTMIIMPFGAILEDFHILEVLLNSLKRFTKSVGGLVTMVVLTCFGINLATASQYMSIVIPGRMYVSEFKKKNLLPQTLSRTLEDSGTLTSPLVPWNLCGVFMATTLGVRTLSYAPYAILNWAVPVIAILYAQFGLFQWKTGEINSSKTYDPQEIAELQAYDQAVLMEDQGEA